MVHPRPPNAPYDRASCTVSSDLGHGVQFSADMAIVVNVVGKRRRLASLKTGMVADVGLLAF